jgi:hypothetical protein
MTGTRWSAQKRTISATSAVESGKATASGGSVRDPGGGVAVLVADRLAGLEAVAETLAEDRR